MSVPASKTPLAGQQGGGEYHIGAGDKLGVFVWQNPDLTGDVVVSPDGKISYPLIGVVDVSGLTTYQLQAKLKEKFSEYVKYVQVTVTVKEYAGNKVVVLGEVVYPGVYTFTGTAITVMEAIGLAGDMTTLGKRESVIVVSDNLTEHPRVRRVNVFMALRRGTDNPDAIVYGGDVVYVPKRFISDFNQFLNDIQPSINTFSSIFQLGTGAGSAARAWFWHRDVNVKPADGN
jgi:polysaccharide export outer membrane protein